MPIDDSRPETVIIKAEIARLDEEIAEKRQSQVARWRRLIELTAEHFVGVVTTDPIGGIRYVAIPVSREGKSYYGPWTFRIEDGIPVAELFNETPDEPSAVFHSDGDGHRFVVACGDILIFGKAKEEVLSEVAKELLRLLEDHGWAGRSR